MKKRRTVWLTAVACLGLAAGLVPTGSRGGFVAPPLAQAQNFGERVVSGTVLDSKSDPVSGATVFLENEKTKTIRSYATDAQGHFNFAQVNMADDYDLWAEKGKKKSATKVVSSWDSRAVWVGDLKLK